MKKSKVILLIALILINLFLVHLFKIKISFQQVLIIHVFLFSLSFLADLIQVNFLKHKNTNIFSLIGINLARILLCIIFLSPIIFTTERAEPSYIYSFFISYFFYLFHDIIYKSERLKKIKM